jgi:hypothetical protein
MRRVCRCGKTRIEAHGQKPLGAKSSMAMMIKDFQLHDLYMRQTEEHDVFLLDVSGIRNSIVWSRVVVG